jgi:hypothetical protein
MGTSNSVSQKAGDIPLKSPFHKNVVDSANVYGDLIPKHGVATPEPLYVPSAEDTNAVQRFIANDTISREYHRLLHEKTHPTKINPLIKNNVAKLLQAILETVNAVSLTPNTKLPDAVAAVCKTIQENTIQPVDLSNDVLKELGYQIRSFYKEPLSFYKAIQEMLRAFQLSYGLLGKGCGSDLFVQYERTYKTPTEDNCNMVGTVYDNPLNRICSGPVIGNYGKDNADIDKTGRGKGSGGGGGGGGSAVPPRAAPGRIAVAMPR